MKDAGLMIIGIITLSVIVVAAVAINQSRKTDSGYGADTDVLQSSAPGSVKQQGSFAPDFLLKTIDGSNISVAQFRGEKPVILDFFATWCPNCRRNTPTLNALSLKYKDSVQVIGVNLQENPSTVASFAKEFDISYPVALDPISSASRSYNVNYTNVHMLIGKDGSLVRTVLGDISETDFTFLIQ